MRKTRMLCIAATALGLSSAAAFYGCTPQNGSTGSSQVAAGSGSSADAELNVQLFLVDKAGAVSRTNTFASKDAVYLELQSLTAGTAVTGQEYLFEVVDAKGKVVSSDDLTCRRFHVTASGTIDRVAAATDASGASCAHATIDVKIGEQSALAVQLIPFADVEKDANGAMVYRVLVAPADACVNGVFPENALSINLTIQSNPAALCGNGVIDSGEQCDDGAMNGGSTDACGTDCKTHVCTTSTPVCGNGVVEGTEECDHGTANGKNGDSCTTECHSTHLCCCGDGVVDPGEQCDLGTNNGSGGTCSDTCQLNP